MTSPFVFRDCTLFIKGTGLEKFTKSFFKKVLAPSEEHDKKILAPYATPAKKFVPCMLKKFIYLSDKILLLFETLYFQKAINSKRYTSLNLTKNLDFIFLWLSSDVGEILLSHTNPGKIP